jgi:hypothetical protein
MKSPLKAHPTFRISALKPVTQKSATNNQISIKNRRYIESLLQKYRVFDYAVQNKCNLEEKEVIAT